MFAGDLHLPGIALKVPLIIPQLGCFGAIIIVRQMGAEIPETQVIYMNDRATTESYNAVMSIG